MRALVLCTFLFYPVAADAAGTCTSVKDIIVGTGFIDQKASVASAGDCCSECNKNPTCVAYTYDTKTKECFLKDNIQGNTSQSDRISGLVPDRRNWYACAGNFSKFPFCDESKPLDERLNDLVSRVHLGDIAGELTARQSTALPDLGVPAYYWGTNAIHGLQNLQCLNGRCPTSFPAPCALAATFNMDNVEAMGEILGIEERAYYNAQAHDSLDTWSPTINLNRDPRWGRNVESAGEDPMVCGLYGAAYTRGLQQEGKDQYLQATVTLKHWMSYTVESYHGTSRHNQDAQVSAWDLVSSFLPQWEIAVKEAGAKGVMCSYNMVNGKPTCGNKQLTDILRDDFNFTGYVTSDTDSCADIWTSHKYRSTGEEAVKECLMSGTDIDSGGTYKKYLQSAVEKNVVDKKFADQALYNSYKRRFEMGMFDYQGAKQSKYSKITQSVIGQEAHQSKSLQASRQAMVLLKNTGVLPAKKGQRVCVIGTSADSTGDLLGNYNGPICPHGGYSCFPTIFAEVSRINGVNATLVTSTDVTAATKAARDADFVVLVASNAKDGGGEGHDRDTIGLASAQINVMTAVLALKKPLVLVLVNGGIIAIDGLKDTAPAILDAFMPGVHGAQAIAETIFGDNNPGGKMPVTMYHSSYVNEVDFLNMSMVAGPGRSYKFYKGTPLFPFGYGLSYTSFDLKAGITSASLASDGSVSLPVTVTNTGHMDGDEVVFVYMTNETDVMIDTPMAMKSLVAFERVHVKAGSSMTLKIPLLARRFALVDSRGQKSVRPGKYKLQVDRGHGDILQVPLEINGNLNVLFTLKPWWNEPNTAASTLIV